MLGFLTLLLFWQEDDAPSKPPDALTKLLSSSDFQQPLLWLLIFVAIFILAFLTVRLRWKEISFFQMVATVSPYFLPLLWFYAVVFDLPKSFDYVRQIGFIKFYFTSHSLSLINEKPQNYCYFTLLLATIPLLIYARLLQRSQHAVKFNTKSYEIVLASIALILSILAAFVLTAIPNWLLDQVVHASPLRLSDIAPYFKVFALFAALHLLAQQAIARGRSEADKIFSTKLRALQGIAMIFIFSLVILVVCLSRLG